MQERVLYFQRDMKKSQLNSYMIMQRQRADAPHTAAAAEPQTRWRASDAPILHRPLHPLCLRQDSPLPTRQCATSCHSRCARDCACWVPACLPLIRICLFTLQDIQWMRLHRQGPRCVPIRRQQPLRCWLGRKSHQVSGLQHVVVQQCLPPQQQRQWQRLRFIQVLHRRVWKYPTCCCFN